MPPMPPMLILLFLMQPEHTPHTSRTGAAARRSHLLTSIAPHSLFVALALALIAEQRQVGSMRQNAPVDVGAVPAQLHGYLAVFFSEIAFAFFFFFFFFFSETTSRHVHPCPNCFSLRTSPVFPQR